MFIYKYENGKRITIMWKTFKFDGNLYVGMIQHPDDWEKLKYIYKGQMTPQQILRARIYNHEIYDSPKPEIPTFGFYPEYSGDKTLKEFFEENQMEY